MACPLKSNRLPGRSKDGGGGQAIADDFGRRCERAAVPAAFAGVVSAAADSDQIVFLEVLLVEQQVLFVGFLQAFRGQAEENLQHLRLQRW